MSESGGDGRIKIMELDGSPGAAAHHQASALFERIWGEPLMEAGLLRALSHAGNYVAGAWRGEQMVGAAVAFFTAQGGLHSHIAGVAPEARGAGVGRMLKSHQRSWALERGIGTIVWTFDPLVRRNAHFNMHVLGAMPAGYLPDFYGMMQDELNDASPSDRLYTVWDLHAPVPPEPGTSGELVERGAAVLLEPGGEHPAALPREGRLLVSVPEDVEALRARHPEATARLRFAVREALMSAMDAGMRVTGITRDGYYVLEGGAS
ncbi:GNAT family N-acetyltransferase [Actinocorallia populi]|uniref:GNAT family N-acetyltransferase n=1 Tax=Actinocorallia populi TaxID=2079200 RepID=UPI0018E560CC|nr:GNAT family N-acetyltransferase [Actinocorallia populi]